MFVIVVVKAYESPSLLALNIFYDIVFQFFFKKGYVDRVVSWLETFTEEIQDNVKVVDEELNNVSYSTIMHFPTLI